MVLPTYLNIKEAAKRIQQKCREPVTPEWLLQHASEGRLQLFALLREDACILKPGIKIDPATLRTLSTLDKAMMSAKKIHEATTVAEKAGTYIHMSDQLARTMLVNKSVSSISVTFKGKQKPAVDRRFVYINEIDGSVRALPGFTIKMDDLRFLSEDIERLIDANQPAAATHPKVSPGDTAAQNDSSQTTKPKPCTRSAILAAAWPLPNSVKLEGLLSDVPQWLNPALVARGAPGRCSSLWNPAQIAVCLATKKSVKMTALTPVIRNSFPEFLNEWENAVKLLESDGK